MIQRKQTLFLLLALIATVVCLMLSIASFEPKTLGEISMTNLFVIGDVRGDVGISLVWPLFAILLLTCPINIYAIFSFHHRKWQMAQCMVCIVLILVWYVVYALYCYVIASRLHSSWLPEWGACLPMVSLVLYVMARHGIRADERLVRAADRIR